MARHGERSAAAILRGGCDVYHEPKRVELARVDRAKALATAANFVTYAVARRKVERSYDLTAPALKGGLSRAEWSTQDIPVVPFPVEEARWKIEYSYSDALGLQVMLFPTAASKLRPSMFAMELTPTGHGKNKWLVSSWAPVGMTGANAAAAAPPPSRAGPAACRTWATACRQVRPARREVASRAARTAAARTADRQWVLRTRLAPGPAGRGPVRLT